MHRFFMVQCLAVLKFCRDSSDELTGHLLRPRGHTFRRLGGEGVRRAMARARVISGCPKYPQTYVYTQRTCTILYKIRTYVTLCPILIYINL